MGQLISQETYSEVTPRVVQVGENGSISLLPDWDDHCESHIEHVKPVLMENTRYVYRYNLSSEGDYIVKVTVGNIKLGSKIGFFHTGTGENFGPTYNAMDNNVVFDLQQKLLENNHSTIYIISNVREKPNIYIKSIKLPKADLEILKKTRKIE
jgi:hypothetical protein